MDIWATCETCVRTFYVPDSAIDDLTQTRCPVCDTQPHQFESRNGGAIFEVAVASAPDGVPADSVAWQH